MELELYHSLPIFGEVEIKLYDDASMIYELFRGDIERLKNVPHLGIIHQTLGIPMYTRYDHIITMMTLVQEIKKHVSNPRFSTPIKLNNNVEYTSIEDFLKSWSLLYSLGHLYTTFTAEHAFLRYLLNNPDFHKEFYEDVEERVKRHFKNRGRFKYLDNIMGNLQNIIKTENIMRVYKIFTLLKLLNVLDKIKDSEKENYKKLRELTTFIFLRHKYLDSVKITEQRLKLQKIIDYFITIRMLAFTILDGSFAPSHLRFEPLRVIHDIEKFVVSREYKQLLNSIHRFYTSTIYQTPKNMYYHHVLVKEFEQKIFSNFSDSKVFIDALLNNELDIKIREVLENLKTSETEHIRIENKYNIVRLNIPSNFFPNPVTWELHELKKISIIGGVGFNLSKNMCTVDLFFPKNYKSQNNFQLIVNTLLIFENLYNVIRQKSFEIPPNYRIVLGYVPYFMFSPLAEYILKTTIRSDLRFPKYFIKGSLLTYPILFARYDLDDTLSFIKFTAKALQFEGTKKIESEYSQKALKYIIHNLDTSKFFIYSPNVVISNGTDNVNQEIDFLLVGISENAINMYIGEIKSNGDFNNEQLLRELEAFFGISPQQARKILVSESSKISHPEYHAEISQIIIGSNTNTTVNLESNKIRIFRKSIRPLDASPKSNIVWFSL
ncbi:hypothetical protein [Thermococcus nautili]|uniref:Uncharacterized protein n=1 Tax=Thermococcus nautili TaxID=195522 RepID=W8P4G5_9EURY|nr:hypothetical protein [Thermococcus nautili]AHL22335.1 hypothetical protein BD01_0712 [Thermococcus nautili]